jgi:hypothetical protein
MEPKREEQDIFPGPICELPEADLPFPGAWATLFQGECAQGLFMRFDEDTNLPEHSHAWQWGIVLEGRIDLVIDGNPQTFTRGDRYFIPEGVRHSGKIHAGYADITFFGQKDRYSPKRQSVNTNR